MNLNDTIVACATPAGYSGIAVIRLSGVRAFELVKEIFKPVVVVNDFQPNHAYYGKILKPNSEDIIDSIIVTFFLAPHSYTGEDVVELSCHGNPLIVEQIINVLIGLGARFAQRGEFTRRALLNGKIDLLQAEAVLDTVYAPCEEARKLAIAQHEGNLSNKIYELKSKIIDLLTVVEVNIDFSEEEDVSHDDKQLTKNIENIITEIDELLKGAETGIKIKDGHRVLIIGRTNVGKSTLFNKLIGYDRAIIHEQPGTTRDYIEEGVEIAGLYVRFLDTAGFFHQAHGPDKIAQERSVSLINSADLIILIFDGSEPLNEEDVYLFNLTKEKNKLLVVNKIDLNICLDDEKILTDSIKLSAKTGHNFELLKDSIRKSVLPQFNFQNIILTRQRHIQALKIIENFLRNAKKAQNLETIAFELHSALDTIGELTGQVMRQEILNKIFDEFCIGK